MLASMWADFEQLRSISFSKGWLRSPSQGNSTFTVVKIYFIRYFYKLLIKKLSSKIISALNFTILKSKYLGPGNSFHLQTWPWPNNIHFSNSLKIHIKFISFHFKIIHCPSAQNSQTQGWVSPFLKQLILLHCFPLNASWQYSPNLATASAYTLPQYCPGIESKVPKLTEL